jgi:hypothetical protein
MLLDVWDLRPSVCCAATFLLSYASEALKDDREFMLSAAKQSWRALYHAESPRHY